MSMNVLEASGLGKRHGRTWALRECTLEIPAGQLYITRNLNRRFDLAVQPDLAASRQASLEEHALNYLRETPTEVAK